jgi:amino acid transporter
MSPSVVFLSTRSVLIALLSWTLGGLYSLISVLLYTEYALSIPYSGGERVYLEAIVPQNGGYLNYVSQIPKFLIFLLSLTQLKHLFPRSRYRKGALQLCLFLFTTLFITLGNMAGNSVSFAIYVMKATGSDSSGTNMARIIAITCIVVCFLANATSRRAGIWLNNAFALLKVLSLLGMIAVGFIMGMNLKHIPEGYIDNIVEEPPSHPTPNSWDRFIPAFLAISK